MFAFLETPLKIFLRNSEYIIVFHHVGITFEQIQNLIKQSQDPILESKSESAELSVEGIPPEVKDILLQQLWPNLQIFRRDGK